jgi:hypothetical protein
LGLKYSLFLIKISSKELLQKLIATGLIDQTEQMKKDIKWEKDQLEQFQKISKDNTIEIKQKLEKIDELMKIEPGDEALRNYQKWEKDPAMTHLFIWWKQLAGTQFVYGGFTTYLFERRLFEGYMSLLFYRAKLTEWMFVDYAHTANEGTALLAKMMEDKVEYKIYEQLKSENERFEKYAKRVEKESNYPITEMHNELLDASDIDWDHCVVFKLEKKAKAGGVQNEEKGNGN